MTSKKLVQGIVLIATAHPMTAIAESYFAGYEFGQMAFNNFRKFAGEFGYIFDNKDSLRVSIMNVALSERHLSSNEASAVDGDNVEGLWHGINFHYDFSVTENIFLSPSIGYQDVVYTHTILKQSVNNTSRTAGLSVSYLGDTVFGQEKLYWRFSAMFQYMFDAEGKVKLGESTVNRDSVGITPSIYVGYKFD